MTPDLGRTDQAGSARGKPRTDHHSWGRWLVLLAGLVIPQFVLFGPSLLGWRILLPLDILKAPSYYLPADPDGRPAVKDMSGADLVVFLEMNRRFAVSEVRAGRLPLWTPHNYCGTPFLANAQSAVLSPFRLLDYAWPDPQALAWGQLLRAMVAGIGAYLFFTRALGVGFAPAVIGAWCYPLTFFLVGWAGFPVADVTLWTPWVMLGMDRSTRRPGGYAPLGLAMAVALMLLSGHPAAGGHVLVASSLYAMWCWIGEHGLRRLASWPSARSALAVGGGVVLGFLLAAPQLLPTIEYLQQTPRMMDRIAGRVETAAQGWGAIPQMVLPFFYGTGHSDSRYVLGGALIESAACGYAGLLVALVLAPLSLLDARRRSAGLFWLALACFALVPTLDLPLIGRVFHWPPLNLLRNNRFVWATGWSLLVMGVMGLDALCQHRNGSRRCPGGDPWRWRSPLAWTAGAIPAALGFWCLHRWLGGGADVAGYLDWLAQMLQAGRMRIGGPYDLDAVEEMRLWFERMYLAGFILCALAVALWLALHRPVSHRPAFMWSVGFLAVAEMVAMDYGFNTQADPALYYPRLRALQAVATMPPGRICGLGCLPASLNQSHDLPDVRGYDGADPYRIVELLLAFRRPGPPGAHGSAVQLFSPQWPSPLADLLNLRYLIGRGPAPPEAVFAGEDYWVVENPTVLPRAYVPAMVKVVNDDGQRLQLLTSPDYDPRQVTYIESDVPVPGGPCRGSARIIEQTPSRLLIAAELSAPGIIRVADQWDRGWKAWLDGRPVPILRADHALRGVIAPAGKVRLEMRYEPESFAWGCRLAAAAAVILIGWAGVKRLRNIPHSPFFVLHSSSCKMPPIT